MLIALNSTSDLQNFLFSLTNLVYIRYETSLKLHKLKKCKLIIILICSSLGEEVFSSRKN